MQALRFTEETLDDYDRAKSVGHYPTTRIPLLLDFCRPIFIGVSLRDYVSLHDSLSKRLKCHRRISLMRSTVAKCHARMITIKWTEIHLINARHFTREIRGSSMCHVAYKKKEKQCPSQRKLKEKDGYKT